MYPNRMWGKNTAGGDWGGVGCTLKHKTHTTTSTSDRQEKLTSSKCGLLRNCAMAAALAPPPAPPHRRRRRPLVIKW